ncbi:MAG: YigZ family protein [SAR324 cluster bacterium]|uniref:YigZ family protein n=1 Tax=SAR324 cluster bacterium TaxID=2024889 RepID=A0A2A4SQ78_9DELT|nr:MAG: YigZ family protein [SAR324 cluster bacterium]
MPSNSYLIPAEHVRVEKEIKRSRFIALTSTAVGRASALEFLEKVRHEFPDARHHCWAYIAGNPAHTIELGYSDDGEPRGTAGKPIFNVLRHKKIGELVVVVVRYFGGIKLGTGGLVRAYSGVTQEALELLQVTTKSIKVGFLLYLPYTLENKVRHYMTRPYLSFLKVDYGEAVVISLEVEENMVKAFHEELTNLSAGRVRIEKSKT